MHTDHKIIDLVGMAEEDAGLYQQLAVVCQNADVIARHIGRLQGKAQITRIEST